MRTSFLAVLALASVSRPVLAQSHRDHHPPDSGWKAMQERGRQAMGVDQYSSFHRFDVLPDGGRIELQRPEADEPEVEVIRDHLRDIAQRFAAGDFSIPGFVHDQVVPGTEVLASRRGRIRYRFEALPKGGAVRIVTKDRLAREALVAFMAYQRREHRAGGHSN
jgi:hypothetical protein